MTIFVNAKWCSPRPLQQSRTFPICEDRNQFHLVQPQQAIREVAIVAYLDHMGPYEQCRSNLATLTNTNILGKPDTDPVFIPLTPNYPIGTTLINLVPKTVYTSENWEGILAF